MRKTSIYDTCHSLFVKKLEPRSPSHQTAKHGKTCYLANALVGWRQSETPSLRRHAHLFRNGPRVAQFGHQPPMAGQKKRDAPDLSQPQRFLQTSQVLSFSDASRTAISFFSEQASTPCPDARRLIPWSQPSLNMRI